MMVAGDGVRHERGRSFRLSILIAAVVSLTALESGRADRLVYESFDYPAGTLLDGVVPTGENLTGTYESYWPSPTPDQTLAVAAPGLDYGSLGNAPTPAANRVGGVVAEGTVEVDQDVIVAPGDTIFFSALFRFDDSQDPLHLANITLNNADTGGLIFFGQGSGVRDLKVGADTPTAFGSDGVSGAFSDGDVLFLVGRYSDSPAPGGDTLDLLVYDTADDVTLPETFDLSDPNAKYALGLEVGYYDIDLGKVSSISFNVRGLDDNFADELRVGETYADVVGDQSTATALGPCGDVDEDGTVAQADLALYRSHLADPIGTPLGTVGEARCRVHLDSVGCDLLSAVVLARRLAVPLRGPGIEPACSDVSPLDLGVNLSSQVATQVVDAAGGEVEVVGDDGTLYRLILPAGAVSQPGGIPVTLRAISSLSGFGGSGGFLAGVQLEPDGLVLGNPAVLRIEFAAPPPATALAALGYGGSGGEAGFVPALVGTTGTVSSIELPITHFSGAAAVGASADEVASTPWPPTAQDAPYMQRLATLVQLGVEEGLVGNAFQSDADAQASILRAMRDWRDDVGGRLIANFDTCTDVTEIFRSLNGWSIQDQLLGTTLGSSTDAGDQQAWLELRNAAIPTYGILDARYAQGASFCDGNPSDHCGRFVERNDVINCHLLSDFLLQRLEMSPPTNDPLSLCPDTPDRMVFERTDLAENGPFELCPADPFFNITATVQDQDGDPFVIPEPFDWSSSAPGILSLTPHGDYATATPAGGLGQAVITAEWTACPEFPASTIAFVGIAPRLVGPWLASGTLSQVGCQDPSENFPPTSGSEAGEIEAQITNPDGSVTFNLFGPGWEGVATLECGPEPSYSGSDTYFFEGGWGTNTYEGELLSTTGPPGQRVATTLSWSWEATDVVGDTCFASGSGTVTRTVD